MAGSYSVLNVSTDVEKTELSNVCGLRGASMDGIFFIFVFGHSLMPDRSCVLLAVYACVDCIETGIVDVKSAMVDSPIGIWSLTNGCRSMRHRPQQRHL